MGAWAEMTMKQLENLSPPIMKQVLPLVEQLPPLYTDLVNGKENFTPKPEETRRLSQSTETLVLCLATVDTSVPLPSHCFIFFLPP
ncbi:hypothetical protein CsSME_00036573 [Camellia sinensis var. sinensis]